MPKPTIEKMLALESMLKSIVESDKIESPSYLQRRLLQLTGHKLSRRTIKKKLLKFKNETNEYRKQETRIITPRKPKLKPKILKPKPIIEKPIYDKQGRLINSKIQLPPCPICKRKYAINRFNKNESKVCLQCGMIFNRTTWKWGILHRHPSYKVKWI